MVDFSPLPEGVAQLSWPIFVYLSTIFSGQVVTFLHVISSRRRPPAQFEPLIFRQFMSSIALRIRATYVCHAWEPGKEHLLDRSLSVTIPQQALAASGRSLALTKKSATSSKSNGVGGANDEEDILVARLPGETDATFRKRRNAIYARRSYHRRQNEGMVVQNQVTMLETKNTILRQENQRLEQLLQQAQALVDAGASHDPLQFTDLGDVDSVESESDSILDHL